MDTPSPKARKELAKVKLAKYQEARKELAKVKLAKYQERLQHNKARKELVKVKLALLRKVIINLWTRKKTTQVIQTNQTQSTSHLLKDFPLQEFEQQLRARLPSTSAHQTIVFTTVCTASKLSLSDQITTITTIMQEANLLGTTEMLSPEDKHQIACGGLPCKLEQSFVGIPRKKLDEVLEHFECRTFEEMKSSNEQVINVVLFYTGSAHHWAATALYNVLDHDAVVGRRQMLVDVAVRGEGSVAGTGRAGVLNIDQVKRTTHTRSTNSLGSLTYFSNSLPKYNEEDKKVIVTLSSSGTKAVVQYEKLQRNSKKKRSKKSRINEKGNVLTGGQSIGNPIRRRTINANKSLDTQLQPFAFQKEQATTRQEEERDRTLTRKFIEDVRRITSVTAHFMVTGVHNDDEYSSSSPSAEAIYVVMDRVAANVFNFQDPNETHFDGTNHYHTGLTSPVESGQSYHFPHETSLRLVDNSLFLVRAFLRIAYSNTSVTVMSGADLHSAPSISLPSKGQTILGGDRFLITSASGGEETRVLERGSTCTYASRLAVRPDPLLSVMSKEIGTFGDLFHLLKKGQYIVLHSSRIYRIAEFNRHENRAKSNIVLNLIRTCSSTVGGTVGGTVGPVMIIMALDDLERDGVFCGWASGRGGAKEEVGLVRPAKLIQLE